MSTSASEQSQPQMDTEGDVVMERTTTTTTTATPAASVTTTTTPAVQAPAPAAAVVVTEVAAPTALDLAVEAELKRTAEIRAEATLITSRKVQEYLSENFKLMQTILACHNSGRIKDASVYQKKLQENLIFLSSIADINEAPLN
jgi:hypothetical protein